MLILRNINPYREARYCRFPGRWKYGFLEREANFEKREEIQHICWQVFSSGADNIWMLLQSAISFSNGLAVDIRPVSVYPRDIVRKSMKVRYLLFLLDSGLFASNEWQPYDCIFFQGEWNQNFDNYQRYNSKKFYRWLSILHDFDVYHTRRSHLFKFWSLRRTIVRRSLITFTDAEDIYSLFTNPYNCSIESNLNAFCHIAETLPSGTRNEMQPRYVFGDVRQATGKLATNHWMAYWNEDHFWPGFLDDNVKCAGTLFWIIRNFGRDRTSHDRNNVQQKVMWTSYFTIWSEEYMLATVCPL